MIFSEQLLSERGQEFRDRVRCMELERLGLPIPYFRTRKGKVGSRHDSLGWVHIHLPGMDSIIQQPIQPSLSASKVFVGNVQLRVIAV